MAMGAMNDVGKGVQKTGMYLVKSTYVRRIRLRWRALQGAYFPLVITVALFLKELIRQKNVKVKKKKKGLIEIFLRVCHWYFVRSSFN